MKFKRKEHLSKFREKHFVSSYMIQYRENKSRRLLFTKVGIESLYYKVFQRQCSDLKSTIKDVAKVKQNCPVWGLPVFHEKPYLFIWDKKVLV